MIHLVYNSGVYLNIYLNIDMAKVITIDTIKNRLCILYADSDEFILDISQYPKVKEFLEKYDGDKDEIIKRILFEVFDIILERLSKTDEKMSPIFYLGSVLNTIVFKLNQK